MFVCLFVWFFLMNCVCNINVCSVLHVCVVINCSFCMIFVYLFCVALNLDAPLFGFVFTIPHINSDPS